MAEGGIMRLKFGGRRGVVVAMVAAGILAAFVGGAYSSDVFSDVPSEAFYHNDVTWLANTGLTAGCGGGKFCPERAVTRGQMAVFLHKLVSATRTGHFSCDGTTWEPLDSSMTFGHAGGVYRHRTSTAGNGNFRCNLALPHGSTVTEMTYVVHDSDAVGFVGCQTIRIDQTGTTGAFETLASGATTAAFTGGASELVDSSITNAAIDNSRYSYFAQCAPSTGTSATGIYGATVTYTYTGVPAA
jgi:hypothetical protein